MEVGRTDRVREVWVHLAQVVGKDFGQYGKDFG